MPCSVIETPRKFVDAAEVLATRQYTLNHTQSNFISHCFEDHLYYHIKGAT